MAAPQPALRTVSRTPDLKRGHAGTAVVTVAPQEFQLLSIDYAQGEADLNTAFFFAPLQSRRHRRRLRVGRITAALHRAAEQFPILLGHTVCDNGAGWRVVVDPDNINWPVVTEAWTCGPTIAALGRAGFAWGAWPAETHSPDLNTYDSRPMLGVHIVHYPCGGSSVHAKVRHLAMDGNGVWRFYDMWARNSAAELWGHRRCKPLVSPSSFATGHPLLDRSLLADRLRVASGASDGSASSASSAREYIDGIMRLFREAGRSAPQKHGAMPEPFAAHRFSLTDAAVARLKQQHGDLEACSPAHMRFVRAHGIDYVSTNDLVCALFWRAIARAHHVLRPTDPLTCVMIACDVRGRVGVPPRYSGNASYPLFVHSTKAELARQTLTDTATRIRQHVAAVTPELVALTADFMASPESRQGLVSMIDPARAFFSASIVNGIPMYAMSDFGFGRPVHVGIPAYLIPGFSIWMPARPADQSTYIKLALTDSVFALVKSDPEFRQFVDVMH
ncbi:hypothetical protein H4R19_001066 [Coemansia spiralis]|nr:hypothetical protein H4R19_001066 [Coemansia spiralis]